MPTADRPPYPPTRQGPESDDFHGVRVPDPYRWLEHADSGETVQWVAAQNALTRRWLEVPDRDAITARLAELHRFPRRTAPVERGGRLFFTFHDGVSPQPQLCVEEQGHTRVLVDPSRLSADGTVALTGFWPDWRGARVAYALSERGSDWQSLHVLDVASLAPLADVIEWAKFTEVAWLPDGEAFFYTRFPQPGTVPAGDEHYSAYICRHTLGAPQAADAVVYARPDDRDVVPVAEVCPGASAVVFTTHRGASEDSEIHWAPLADVTRVRAIFTGFTAAHHTIDVSERWVYVRTTHGAGRGRIVKAHLDTGEVRDVIAEQADTLADAACAGGRLVCVFMRQASHVVRVFTLDGGEAGDLPLPPFVSVSELTGERDQPRVFVRAVSFSSPPRIWSYDTASGAIAEWPDGAGDGLPDTGGIETRQVWYTSRDGTRVSMFVVTRAGTSRDGDRPVVLTGYGGFNIPLTPGYDPSIIIWVERGGVLAVPNLRGGSEYGDAWHRAGMLDRKQNVFDDFIAAAEWLVAERYTRPERLAIEGGSNGGLLVGAVLMQRPELFGAVVCRVPVADMLRYHLFTVGRFWIPEYGCADDPTQFPFLHAYSPLHNVHDGVRYPPVLIMTADTDDRVSPGMAKKLAARLQAAVSPDGGPILLRVESRAGHGAGKPVSKQIDEETDVEVFLRQTIWG